MKKSISIIVAVCAVLLVCCLQSCHRSTEAPDVPSTPEQVSTEAPDVPSSTGQAPTVNVPPQNGPSYFPELYVNNRVYFLHASDVMPWLSDIEIPDLDDTWTYLGVVEERVPIEHPLLRNFQATSEDEGADIYHSDNGRIFVGISDPISNAVSYMAMYGDCIVVTLDGHYAQYISELEFSRKNILQSSNTDYGALLKVDGAMYRYRGLLIEDNFSLDDLDDRYIYLGDILSSVPGSERPSEDFQVNNTFSNLIGARVYKNINDISTYDFALFNSDIVIIDGVTQLCYANLTRFG